MELFGVQYGTQCWAGPADADYRRNGCAGGGDCDAGGGPHLCPDASRGGGGTGGGYRNDVYRLGLGEFFRPWTDPVPACLVGHNNQVFYGVSFQECQEKCEVGSMLPGTYVFMLPCQYYLLPSVVIWSHTTL